MKNAIILATQRSGSELLRSFLDIHPAIRCESELLHRWPTGGLSLVQFYFTERHLLEDNRLYMFKIMYNQLNKELVEWLIKEKVKVIHLIRQDLLRTAVSHEFKRRRKEIGRPDARAFEKWPVAQLEVNIPWILAEVERIEDDSIYYHKKFSHNPYFKFTYEEMVGESGKEVNTLPQPLSKNILDFLEVGNVELTTRLRKQNPHDLKKMVINYNELMKEVKRLKINTNLEI